jgi:hypothetical protein
MPDDYQYHQYARANNRQRSEAARIAAERIADVGQRRATIAWIWHGRRKMTEIRQLFIRWGVKMPDDF